jgi:hypothetical protein
MRISVSPSLESSSWKSNVNRLSPTDWATRASSTSAEGPHGVEILGRFAAAGCGRARVALGVAMHANVAEKL